MDSVVGVTEKSGTYQEALREIGKQDEEGQTIGIVYVTSGVLSFFPTLLRSLGLLVVLSLYFFHQPLSFLARLKKAMALQSSLDALRRNFELRKSKLKRRAFTLIRPDKVTVLGVSGIGTGVGLGMSKDVVKKILGDGSGQVAGQDGRGKWPAAA